MKYLICILTISAIPFTGLHAQSQFVREGNKLYDEKKYKDAATDYMKALQADPTNTTGLFNLGNSLYQQKQYDASRQALVNTAKAAKDKGSKADANYNIGNTYMQQQKWEDAASAYKSALRNNPQDADAKYNLSYASEMMKKDQQKKDQQKKDQQKQNKQDQKKNQQNKDQQNKDQQQQPQDQPSKLSQQQADQLLDALRQEEKKLQDKHDKEKGVPVRMQKDW